MKKIIFYHPHLLSENPSKGSELRPKKMKEAFENIGHKVELVVGSSKERKASMGRIKKKIMEGETYDFLYAESSNMPIPFADSHHLPLRPLQDYFFFKMLNKYNIPIGLFYRDVYWADHTVQRKLSSKHSIKKIMHWMEWFGIRETVDHLFLPTIGMANYLPHEWPKNTLSALYPGCELKSNLRESVQQANLETNILKIFYVGGVKLPYYDLRPMIKVIGEIEGAKLVLCCRKDEWEEFSYYYDDLDFANVKIVHADSTQIVNYYKKADIVVDIRPPIDYLKNTMPIKIIEAVGYEVPVLVLAGTEYAEFVKDEGTGWVVKSTDRAKILLQNLRNNRQRLNDKVKSIKKVKHRHTWEARAEQASTILSQKDFSN